MDPKEGRKMMSETLLTIREAATLLRVSHRHYVYKLIGLKRLPKRKLNGQIATTLDGVLRYLAERDERRGGRPQELRKQHA